MRLLLSLLLPLLLCTCDSAPDNASLNTLNFFDLKGYIDEEVDRLGGVPLTVDKTITLNGKTETQQLDDLDFGSDLQLFASADINKAAWIDKYNTEVKTMSGSHKITRYTALDTTLTTRMLEVEEDRGQPIQITIKRKTGTFLSDGVSELVYRAANGYTVQTKQDNRFGDDIDALVQVAW
ncbi:hypothetical protein [Neolewinella antarctica]|uniref:Uncharacterized protein n=1 Tax=Neolewinella antarctica TaxID=442734 RepID=A0ABX0XAZ3_9BACT|nr:hypothetical protein [Neolewinella antarctica]NJC25998.1 hypothetical protein [Neolewinella antarctica]